MRSGVPRRARHLAAIARLILKPPEDAMPTFQVTCRELVYIDRTYEIEADDAAQARAAFVDGRGTDGEQVDEMVQDTHSLVRVLDVCDEHGNKVA